MWASDMETATIVIYKQAPLAQLYSLKIQFVDVFQELNLISIWTVMHEVVKLVW